MITNRTPAPTRRRSAGGLTGYLHQTHAEYNTQLSKIRAAVEHAIAHLKTWRMLSEEGGRYRAPITKYASMLKAIIGLFFFSTYE